jgi:hypothetical protein
MMMDGYLEKHNTTVVQSKRRMKKVGESDILTWVMDRSRFRNDNFYFNRELTKYIPNEVINNILEGIRALSKNVAYLDTSFMNLRNKIHGKKISQR